jgi:hypothetical protein
MMTISVEICSVVRKNIRRSDVLWKDMKDIEGQDG